MSHKMHPSITMNLLNVLYHSFDECAERNPLVYKMDVIGDA